MIIENYKNVQLDRIIKVLIILIWCSLILSSEDHSRNWYTFNGINLTNFFHEGFLHPRNFTTFELIVIFFSGYLIFFKKQYYTSRNKTLNFLFISLLLAVLITLFNLISGL